MVDGQEKSIHELLETRYFIPSWWVDAFEKKLKLEMISDIRENIEDFRIGPTFTIKDLYLFPLLISQIQEEAFSGKIKSNLIQMLPQKIIKESGLTQTNLVNQLHDILRSFGSLRLYSKQDSMNTEVIELFIKEIWRKNIPDGRPVLKLGLNDFSKELFFGVINGYKDLFRFIDRKFSIKSILGEQLPLLVRRSMWHEVRGVEQTVLLKMEKSMQWGSCSLNLEGSFGQSFDNLFKHSRRFSKKRDIFQFEKKIEFTKRLSEHGLLGQPSRHEYLAFNDSEPAIQLVWNSLTAREYRCDLKCYLNKIFEIYSFENESLLHLVQVLREKIPPDKAMHEKISKIPTYPEINLGTLSPSEQYCLIDGNTLIPFNCLYWEWVVRKNFLTILPLPEELKHLDEFKQLPSIEADHSRHQESIIKFIRMVSKKEGFSSFLEREAGICIASVKSLEMINSKDDRQLNSFKETTGYDSLQGDTRFSAPETSQIMEKDVSFDMLSPKQAGANHSSKKNVQDVNEVENRRRLVEEELNQKKNKDRESYLNITKMYLESLDIDARNLILDIKGRMQPKVFEKHIQHRLVKFMIEHPKVWQERNNR